MFKRNAIHFSSINKYILIASLLASISFITLTNARLSYIIRSGNHYKTQIDHLKPISTQGQYIKDFDELIEWIKRNVGDSTIVSFPGEDVFYFALQKEPQLRYFHLNPTMFPYTVEYIHKDCVKNKIAYIVLKKNLQCEYGFIDYSNLYNVLLENYYIDKELTNYTIFKLKN